MRSESQRCSPDFQTWQRCERNISYKELISDRERLCLRHRDPDLASTVVENVRLAALLTVRERVHDTE